MIRAALVVARRDFIATVLSRGFLIWLMMPIFGLAVGGVSAFFGANSARNADRSIAVIADAATLQSLRDAAVRIEQLDSGRPQPLSFIPAESDADAQARRLLEPRAKGPPRFAAVLVGGDAPRLFASAEAKVPPLARLQGLIDSAALMRGEAATKHPPVVTVTKIKQPGPPPADRAQPIASGAAGILFMLIGLLAGVLLSNMVEEKSNKVIEVLAAAIPVPAIFAGKLAAMLAISLVGVALWSGIVGAAVLTLLAHVPAGVLPTPAVGWPLMIGLGVVYFTTAFLVYGSLYLGLGSLCSSIREVQSLSLPVTIGQTIIFLSVLRAIDNIDGWWAAVMSIFPLSSPYMMAARAALEPGLGQHLLAIVWQMAFAAVAIWWSSRLFRTGVLHSGPPPSLFKLARLTR